ncbi:DUF6350 family protein [Streptomyces gobiensis]|uniref:cell division protein PerM n=1 Tax=Streptomyces gobiensis TaxID=2875706 RepID=UPI001E2E1C93|nr:DUF6350 family protein [Streptomyces gobiensis]UGY93214.1 DUF6350 family protein [Streptomyces gobiensis]
MSQSTHRSHRRRIPVGDIANWLVEGALAAVLGLAAFAMLVLLLWITSPYPDSGPRGALSIAAELWLLAHGAELVRTDTLSGVPAPVGVTPLLLTVLPVFLLYRVGRASEGAGWRSIGWLNTGYLLIGALVAWYSLGGPIQVSPLSAALQLPPLTVGITVIGAWVARGRPALRRSAVPLPKSLPVWGRWPRAMTALHGAGVATGALLCGGALLAAGALVWHVSVAQAAFPQLTTAWWGRIAVLLLCLALIPNTAVWGAAYGLGPGFSVGGGSSVGPLTAVGGYPQLPHFPLLAALPAEGAGGPLVWAVAGAVPVVAGLVGGWHIAKVSVPVRGSTHGAASWRGTVATVGLAAIGCGAAMAVLATFAGGPLGSDALSHMGPSWWLTGAAALGWTATVGTPTALLVRLWRLREPDLMLAAGIRWRRCTAWFGRLRVRRRRPEEEWHAARRSRWAALKESSGGLMPDLESGHRRDPEPEREPTPR